MLNLTLDCSWSSHSPVKVTYIFGKDIKGQRNTRYFDASLCRLDIFRPFQFGPFGTFYYTLEQTLLNALGTTANRTCQPVHLDLDLSELRARDKANVLGKALGRHLKEVMLVMRMSQVLARTHIGQDRFDVLYKDMFYPDSQGSIAEQPLGRDHGRDDLSKEDTSDLLDMVLQCDFSTTGSCLSRFHHVLTDQGICSAFNSADISSLYHPNNYLQLFKSLYHVAYANTQPIETISSFGKKSRLTLLLDTHQRDIKGSESGHFAVSLSNRDEEMSTEAGVVILPGQRNHVLVEVVKTVSKELKERKTIEERGCRFPDEMFLGDQMFRNYSFAGFRNN